MLWFVCNLKANKTSPDLYKALRLLQTEINCFFLNESSELGLIITNNKLIPIKSDAGMMSRYR